MRFAGIGMFVAMSLVLFGAGISLAKDRGACREDVKKFCSAVEGGKGGIWKCLQGHQNQLSSACQAKMEKKRQAWLVCQADRDKFCQAMEPGKGLRECMKSHEAELKGECREQIQKRERHHGKWKACKGDRERFCGDVQPGDGRVRSCLTDHKKDLSPECKAAIP